MKTIAKYFFISIMMFLLISCAGGSKTEKKDKAVTIEEHFQLAYSAADERELGGGCFLNIKKC